MAKRTKAEALKTRQELIETAIAQFAQHGVSKTTLNDIADAANVTRGAGWETAGAVPLSGRPFCRRIYRFAKDELPAGKSDRHRNRSSAGGAADAKSSASLAAS